VATNAPRSLDPEEPLLDSADPVIDLFLNLAIALEAHGLPSLAQEINKGDKAKPDKALLNLLRHEQILIVVDEFQRLLPKDKSTPPQVWAKLVEDLNNSPHAQGRLLLISNRFIKTERWSENCQVEDFEREVLERALPRLEADLLKFMRWLSVHRRPFKKEALAQFSGGRETPEALRKQLFDRFLLERTAGGDVPHPLAREISVTRLRIEG